MITSINYYFREDIIKENPHDSEVSGSLFKSFKKYITEHYPDGINNEEWEIILSDDKVQVY